MNVSWDTAAGGTPPPMWTPKPPKRRSPAKIVFACVMLMLALIIGLVTLAAIGSSHRNGSSRPYVASTNSVAPPGPAISSQAPAVVVTPDEPEYPPQVAQARSAAQNYLSFMAFSREGLIQQLSSSAGDGYPRDIATQAVDSLNVDWNEQAVKAAENYLNFTSFSCAGLKQQLSAQAGDKFTKDQAAYGAAHTRACK